MTTFELSIRGMNCGHCVKAVEAALRALPGVERVEVEIGRARVEASEAPTREALRAALDDAGFELA